MVLPTVGGLKRCYCALVRARGSCVNLRSTTTTRPVWPFALSPPSAARERRFCLLARQRALLLHEVQRATGVEPTNLLEVQRVREGDDVLAVVEVRDQRVHR